MSAPPPFIFASSFMNHTVFFCYNQVHTVFPLFQSAVPGVPYVHSAEFRGAPHTDCRVQGFAM